MVQCCFTSTETISSLGQEAQDGHLDFHTAPELCNCRVLNSIYANTDDDLKQTDPCDVYKKKFYTFSKTCFYNVACKAFSAKPFISDAVFSMLLLTY